MYYLLGVLIISLGFLGWFVSREPAEVAELNDIAEERVAIQAELDQLQEETNGKAETFAEELPVSSENSKNESDSGGEAVTHETSTTEPDQAALVEQLTALQQQIDTLTYREPEPHKEIVNPSGFVNSEPFELADFVGEKVILLKFTTYSCINCQRTYPYIIDWYETYEDQGLQVVAVHTPEFAFEHKIENVEEAMTDFGIDFPVVLDNDYSTWRAYGNRFWPRLYLIDINGNIVYDHIGEGAYLVTEAKIQKLLAERAELLSE